MNFRIVVIFPTDEYDKSGHKHSCKVRMTPFKSISEKSFCFMKHGNKLATPMAEYENNFNIYADCCCGFCFTDGFEVTKSIRFNLMGSFP